MEFKQEINVTEKEILSPLQLYIEVQKLKWEVARLQSMAVSERGIDGTFQREIKRVRESIDKLEDKLNDPDKGYSIKLDRLVQKQDRQEKINIGITIGVVASLIMLIINYFFRK
jgi:hypothetical protein